MKAEELEAFFARVGEASQLGAVTDGAKVGHLSRLPDFHAPFVVHMYEGDALCYLGDDEEAVRKPRMSVDTATGVATIPITGVLLKAVPAWLRRWGLNATGYNEIEEDVKRAISDQSVKTIRLLVESPGGQVSGVKEAADAIFEARKSKRVVCEIQDLCASGAYWLAAQAHEIKANLNAMVGSIGVYAVYTDYSEAARDAGIRVYVVSSGPHKGMGVPGSKITDEQLEAQQQVIDRMAQNFKVDVLRGRSIPGKEEDWASGRVWLAADALSMGLVDGLTGSVRSGLSPAGARAEASPISYEPDPIPEKATAAHVGTAANDRTPEEEETVMADPKNPAAVAPETQAPQRKPATIAELRAAFKDSDFALAQAEAGASMDEAWAAWGKVLNGREQARELEARRPSPAPGAPAAVGSGAPSTAVDGSQFMKLVEERMKSIGCSKVEAMSYLAGKHRDLYREWEAAADAKALARKEGLAK
jgi:signal peptide peptidase SppA